MTIETEDVAVAEEAPAVVSEATAAEDAEEESAFEAGFEGSDLEPAPQPEPKDEPAEQSGEPAAEPQQALTVEDLRALLEEQKRETAKLRDTFFGKVGNLQQKIDAARTQVSGISPKARERLQADFPELAEMLFEGVPEIDNTPAPQVAQPDIKDLIRREVEPVKLSAAVPDWEEIVASKEFLSWKSSVLDPATAAELDSSWDSSFIKKQLLSFKSWQSAEATKQKQKQERQARLESAITPRGVPRGGAPVGYEDDEEAAMEAAFKKR